MKYYIPDSCDEKGDKDKINIWYWINMEFKIEIGVWDMIYTSLRLTYQFQQLVFWYHLPELYDNFFFLSLSSYFEEINKILKSPKNLFCAILNF